MNLLTQLLANGGIFAVILILMLLEAAVLVPYHLRTGRGIAPLELLLTLASGGSLVFAIGAVVLNAPLFYVGISLGLSLVAHVADICLRWRTSDRHSVSNRRQSLSILESGASK